MDRMSRRDFLKSIGALAGTIAFPKLPDLIQYGTFPSKIIDPKVLNEITIKDDKNDEHYSHHTHYVRTFCISGYSSESEGLKNRLNNLIPDNNLRKKINPDLLRGVIVTDYIRESDDKLLTEKDLPQREMLVLSSAENTYGVIIISQKDGEPQVFTTDDLLPKNNVYCLTALRNGVISAEVEGSGTVYLVYDPALNNFFKFDLASSLKIPNDQFKPDGFNEISNEHPNNKRISYFLSSDKQLVEVVLDRQNNQTIITRVGCNARPVKIENLDPALNHFVFVSGDIVGVFTHQKQGDTLVNSPSNRLILELHRKEHTHILNLSVERNKLLNFPADLNSDNVITDKKLITETGLSEKPDIQIIGVMTFDTIPWIAVIESGGNLKFTEISETVERIHKYPSSECPSPGKKSYKT